MKIQPDCIACILTMAVGTINQMSLKPAAAREFCADIMTLPGLRGEDWHTTSPNLIEKIMEMLTNHTGLKDPFREEKKRLNRQVLEMLPYAQDLVAKSDDPLLAAARLAILGNSIDLMMPGGTSAVETFIRKKAKTPVPEEAYRQFAGRLRTAKQVVYFSDNCGEILFDRLLIKTLKSVCDADVTVVVRSLPALNDVTMKEAGETGLDQVARVMENGVDGPLPGTVLARCSQTVRDLVDNADLVIAKGVGNFDSLEEELGTFKTDLTFMLLSKCRPVSRYFSVEMPRPILANFYH